MYRFACLFLLSMAISTMNAQTFAPVTPTNMSEVVAEMYDYYGNQIQVTPSDLEAFLTTVQTNYLEDLAIPQVQATEAGLGYVTWGLTVNTTYSAGYLNVVSGASNISDFAGNEYTFDGLINGNLHLFVFGTKQGSGQSGLEVVFIDPSNIIIIDDKIMREYKNECTGVVNAAVSNNHALVNMVVGDSLFFRVTVIPLDNITVSDTFVIWARNFGYNIKIQFSDRWSLENKDNSRLNGYTYIGSNRTGTTQFTLQQLINSSGIREGFRINNTRAGISTVSVRVDRCISGPNTPSPSPSNNNSNRISDISPNPFRYSTTLNLSNYEIEQAKIIVFNNTGQPVLSDISVPDGVLSQTIDGSMLPAGTYFIGLYLPSGTHFFKAVKMSE